jgi:hypothetical protein
MQPSKEINLRHPKIRFQYLYRQVNKIIKSSIFSLAITRSLLLPALRSCFSCFPPQTRLKTEELTFRSGVCRAALDRLIRLTGFCTKRILARQLLQYADVGGCRLDSGELTALISEL